MHKINSYRLVIGSHCEGCLKRAMLARRFKTWLLVLPSFLGGRWFPSFLSGNLVNICLVCIALTGWGVQPRNIKEKLGRNGLGLLVVSLRSQSSRIFFLSLGISLPKLCLRSRGSRNLIITASLANLKDSKL